MKVKVLEFEKKLFDGEATRVILPAIDGEMCLLPHHISIITPLRKGVIKVFKPNGEYPVSIELEGGVCSFSDNIAVFIIKNTPI